MKKNREENINTLAYWDKVYASERQAGRRRLYHDLWIPLLRWLPEGPFSVVDIGCGAGELLKFLREKRPEYQLYGTDISQEGLATASLNCPCASFYLAQEDSFNLPPGDWDIAIISEVMEHIPQPGPFLKRVINLLKPSGQLLVTTPWQWGSSDPEHIWDYEGPEDFFALAGDFLELVGTEITNRGYTLVTVWRKK